MEAFASTRLNAEVANLAVIRRFVEESGNSLGLESDCLNDVILAVDEAVTNIIQHGYRERTGPVELSIGRQDRYLVVQIQDQAPHFDLTRQPAPDLSLPLEIRPLGKMGIYLIFHLMDVVHHHTIEGGGNLLVLKKECYY